MALAALTVSTHYAIPFLVGKGLTEHGARVKLNEARRSGHTTAVVKGTKLIPIKYEGGVFTIENPR